MTNGNQQVLEELKEIKGELDYIKKHMVDVDSVMSEDDRKAYEEYLREKKAGKLTAHEKH